MEEQDRKECEVAALAARLMVRHAVQSALHQEQLELVQQVLLISLFKLRSEQLCC